MKDHTDNVDFCETAYVSSDVRYYPTHHRAQISTLPTYPKRLFDLGFAMVVLPILVPVLAILWMLASRGGPGLYYQNRVGRYGKVFRCYKFRTMVLDAEKALEALCQDDPEVAEEWRANQKLENDPRITPIGRFLRATSLDELPQIWNVVKGDMSLVGPRPFMENQDTLYRAAGGHSYYNLRPGITGLWQIEGRGTSSFLSRISYDNTYNDRQSFWMDLCLILKTVTVVFKKTGH
ncbi:MULTISPECIES: sugar transferase [Falsihalocynthiibacter]|uniref:sugar transferase n=1 Tax=Falsihalocynthiibacter TaxID=2854182 RepID=UPI0030038FCC